MSVLSDKLKVLTEQAKQASRELQNIMQEREKYKDCVIVYRDNRNRIQGNIAAKQIGLIVSVDFTRNSIAIRNTNKSETVTLPLETLEYEIINKEDFFERLD